MPCEVQLCVCVCLRAPRGWFGCLVVLCWVRGAVPACILIPHRVFLHRNTKLVSPYTVLLISRGGGLEVTPSVGRSPSHPPLPPPGSHLVPHIAQGEASRASGIVEQIHCHLLGNTDRGWQLRKSCFLFLLRLYCTL